MFMDQIRLTIDTSFCPIYFLTFMLIEPQVQLGHILSSGFGASILSILFLFCRVIWIISRQGQIRPQPISDLWVLLSLFSGIFFYFNDSVLCFNFGFSFCSNPVVSEVLTIIFQDQCKA